MRNIEEGVRERALKIVGGSECLGDGQDCVDVRV